MPNNENEKPPPYEPNPKFPPPYSYAGQDVSQQPRVVVSAPIMGQAPPQNYGATTVVITNPSDNIIIVGGCPACRVGVLEDDFTCLGIFCAIFFFPVGILCCLALRNKRCTNCGAYFG